MSRFMKRLSPGERKIQIILGLNAVFALIVGVAYYMFFRPGSVIAKVSRSLVGVNFPALGIADNPFAIFINSHLTDFLWAYSMTATVSIFVPYIPRIKKTVFVLCLIADTVVELVQINSLTATFDVFDILIQIAASILVEKTIAWLTRRIINEPTE